MLVSNSRASGRMTWIRERTTAGMPWAVLHATRSLSRGEYRRTSSFVTPCQMGRITLLPWTSRENNALSSFWGQFFAKKEGLSTTIPNLDLARPRSIDSRRLSPIFSVNESNQTLRPCFWSSSTRATTKGALSSDACDTKASHSKLESSNIYRSEEHLGKGYRADMKVLKRAIGYEGHDSLVGFWPAQF